MDVDFTGGAELARVFERGTGSFLPEHAVDAGLDLMIALSVLAVPGCAEAGFLLFDDDGRRVCRAGSGARAATIGAAQEELDEGPSIDAGARREVVRSDDVQSDPRWSRLSGAAAELGLHASISAPVVAGEDVLGTLDLYGERAEGFDERTAQIVHVVAAQAALLVATAGAYRRAGRFGPDVRASLRSRDVLNQAKGIVMARERTSEQGAFAYLVGLTERDGRTLEHVARRLVAATARGSR